LDKDNQTSTQKAQYESHRHLESRAILQFARGPLLKRRISIFNEQGDIIFLIRNPDNPVGNLKCHLSFS